MGRPPNRCPTCGAIRGQRPPPEQWFTKKEIAKLLACSLSTLNRLIDSGQLRTYAKGSSIVGSTCNTVRISQTDFEAYRDTFKHTGGGKSR